jgi:hypothetical protein
MRILCSRTKKEEEERKKQYTAAFLLIFIILPRFIPRPVLWMNIGLKAKKMRAR